MTERKHLAVPEDIVIAIGKVAIAAGRVELVALDFAYELGIRGDPTQMQLRDIQREVKGRLKRPLDEHATADPHAITEWFRQVIEVFDDRNQILHGAVIFQMREDGLQPVRHHIRGRQLHLIKTEDLDAVTTRLGQLQRSGIEIQTGLMVRMPGGGLASRTPRPKNPPGTSTPG